MFKPSNPDMELKYDQLFKDETDKSSCPLSYTEGMRVLRKTLANHVNPKFWNEISHNVFYFCPKTNCPVIYFNHDKHIIFSIYEVDSIVTHKLPIGTGSRPICYCKNVLESTIIEELTIKGCCDSIMDIQTFTEANTGKNCAITNPSGRCCGKELKKLLQWVKEISSVVENNLMDQAISCCSKIETNVK